MKKLFLMSYFLFNISSVCTASDTPNAQTDPQIVACTLRYYYLAVAARQFCKPAIQQNKRYIAAYLGTYIHGIKWEEKITNDPREELDDAAKQEVVYETFLNTFVKRATLEEITTKVRADRREDVLDFIASNM